LCEDIPGDRRHCGYQNQSKNDAILPHEVIQKATGS
jgi:hypothetical protein